MNELGSEEDFSSILSDSGLGMNVNIQDALEEYDNALQANLAVLDQKPPAGRPQQALPDDKSLSSAAELSPNQSIDYSYSYYEYEVITKSTAPASEEKLDVNHIDEILADTTSFYSTNSSEEYSVIQREHPTERRSVKSKTSATSSYETESTELSGLLVDDGVEMEGSKQKENTVTEVKSQIGRGIETNRIIGSSDFIAVERFNSESNENTALIQCSDFIGGNGEIDPESETNRIFGSSDLVGIESGGGVMSQSSAGESKIRIESESNEEIEANGQVGCADSVHVESGGRVKSESNEEFDIDALISSSDIIAMEIQIGIESEGSETNRQIGSSHSFKVEGGGRVKSESNEEFDIDALISSSDVIAVKSEIGIESEGSETNRQIGSSHSIEVESGGSVNSESNEEFDIDALISSSDVIAVESEIDIESESNEGMETNTMIGSSDSIAVESGGSVDSESNEKVETDVVISSSDIIAIESEIDIESEGDEESEANGPIGSSNSIAVESEIDIESESNERSEANGQIEFSNSIAVESEIDIESEGDEGSESNGQIEFSNSIAIESEIDIESESHRGSEANEPIGSSHSIAVGSEIDSESESNEGTEANGGIGSSNSIAVESGGSVHSESNENVEMSALIPPSNLTALESELDIESKGNETTGHQSNVVQIESKHSVQKSSKIIETENVGLRPKLRTVPSSDFLSDTSCRCDQSHPTRFHSDDNDDDIRIPVIPACLRRTATIQEPKRVHLSFIHSTHYQQEPVRTQTHDEDELKLEDLSESIITPEIRERKRRTLSLTPVFVQTSVKPKENLSQSTAHVSFDPKPIQLKPRITPSRLTSSFLTSRLSTNSTELIDQNYLNTLQSARTQLAHIRESINSARRLRTDRSFSTVGSTVKL